LDLSISIAAIIIIIIIIIIMFIAIATKIEHWRNINKLKMLRIQDYHFLNIHKISISAGNPQNFTAIKDYKAIQKTCKR
jgi:hypothetical protein